MATTEHTINDALASALRDTRRAWKAEGIVRSENTGMLKDGNRRPDILVLEASVSPVVIETEVLPAVTVEEEAVVRLGEHLRATGRMILSAVAVRLPIRLRTKDSDALKQELESASDLEIALYTGTKPTAAVRWPHSGWIQGSVADLSVIVQSASVPPEVIEGAADELVSGVSDAAGLMGEMVKAHPGSIHKIGEALRQEDGEQTRRMAAAILANAFVFQESLAGGPGELADVISLEQLRSSSGVIGKSAVLAEWRKILKVNYWPIFDIAKRILEVIPAPESQALIERLAGTANKLLENRLMRSHDLTGAVFQRLIADRKFLAAFYTTPASAALLTGLAITPELSPKGLAWGNENDVGKLRIADFACGTGTLLSTAYQRVGQLHELAGGDAEALHPQMMAHGLIGCDVLPAAAHLTASMLSGAHPTVKYTQSSILTVAYGKQPDGTVALGSLDLLDPQGTFGILSVTAKAAEGLGEAEKETWSTLPHESFDLVLMNPPFTRATGQEGKKIGVPNPMFAAFGSTEEEQRLMGGATKLLTQHTSAHGNAGEASIFLVLADRKLKPGGMLGLVMPLSLMSGDAWEESRELLSREYDDLILVSIAGVSGGYLSFSADTKMGECLVVGRKGSGGSKRATFVVLNERPSYPLLGASIARLIRKLKDTAGIRGIEDGPLGGTLLHFGDDVVGQMVEASASNAEGWSLARVADIALSQTAHQIINNQRIWLPSMAEADAIAVPITKVANIGKVGPYHADINGATANGGIRGPFDVEGLKPGSAPTYPILWSHDAENQTTMAFEADSEGIPKAAKQAGDKALIDQKIVDIQSTASHCHFSRDFRFNSQSTSMQFTDRRTIGGRAWISIQLASVEQEKALVLWANTSLGLLLHWYSANKQQSGRGSVGVLPLQRFPILDVAALKPAQLKAAAKLFDTMKGKALLPFHEIDKDPVREELDRKFLGLVLGSPSGMAAPGGALELLRMKLSREPSIRGNKA